ncbi:MAG: hypothetical protein IKM76_11005 [Prevotella sp.]|nr:hypothetical protein [Prevotella sp.]
MKKKIYERPDICVVTINIDQLLQAASVEGNVYTSLYDDDEEDNIEDEEEVW